MKKKKQEKQDPFDRIAEALERMAALEERREVYNQKLMAEMIDLVKPFIFGANRRAR